MAAVENNQDALEGINSTSSIDENVNPEVKKRKTHRLKQRFQVIKKIGQGSYGKVQLAINNETGQEVAIKTIKKSKVESEQDLIRIRREIQIMSSIHHPHIIRIYEVFENKDKIVLVMQYASGGEIYDYVSYHKVLTDSDARRLFRQIATAIYYCHKNKICHRDLKLENIILDAKGNAKIADFGLSNVFDEKHFLQTFCGSPLYASPEIVRGLPYFGPEVDCWSLGVLLYTLVYGAMPFDGSNFKKLVKQISEASYYEPPNKSAASELIRKLLMPNPRDRATIVDICTDEWVNQDFEHSLLQVAEDLSNLTPVRCDLLTALAPASPSAESKKPTEAEACKVVPTDDKLDEPGASDDVASVATNMESTKRPVDNTSFNASPAEVNEKKSSKKKTKRAVSDATVQNSEIPKGDSPKSSPENQTMAPPDEGEPEKEKSQQRVVKAEPCISEATPTKETNGDLTQILRKESIDLIPETTGSKVSQSESISKMSNASSSSVCSQKRPGRLSIPKIWDSSRQEIMANSPEEASKCEKKAPFIPVGLKVSEAKKVIERRCSVDSSAGSQLKRRDTLSSATELSVDRKLKSTKKYTGRSLSLNLQEVSGKTKKEPLQMHTAPKEVVSSNESIPKKCESESPSKPSTPISEEDKSLAKQIIKKNIARAKLMEKQQTSISPDTETRPLLSIENSNISIIESMPKHSGIGVDVPPESKSTDGLVDPSLNAAPITRSYKKVTFTKGGACITESGKFYTHDGKDGYTTRVEKKSMVTHIISDDPSSINIQRSDSQSSSGSTDIFDDIFDNHWTGDVFSNVKSLFNNIFESSSRRFNERKSLRSRAESLERNNSDWLRRRQNRKSIFAPDDDDSPGSSLFDSQRSLLSNTSAFTRSIKSSFDKRMEDLLTPLTTRSKLSYPLPKFGSRFSRESSLHRDSDTLDNRLVADEANEQSQQDTTRRRVEQWLHSDDGKDLETYGTIGPRNFRRYVRTMTSSDSASNLFKRMQVSTSSERSTATGENVESANAPLTVARDNEIEMRFNLEGGSLLTGKSEGTLFKKEQTEQMSTVDSGIKIAETSSLLEQLRTFGYKSLVSRRLSESSSTEDIDSQEQTSEVNLKETASGTTIRREVCPSVASVANIDHSVSETRVSFRRQESREVTPSLGERLRKDGGDGAPAEGLEVDFKSESVQERIHRKSYFSRFNEDTRNSYTVRQRRRSMTRFNEHSEFFSSSSNVLSRNSSSSSKTIEPRSPGTLSSYFSFDPDRHVSSSDKSLADLASDISSRYSGIGRQSSPRSNRSSDDEADQGRIGKGSRL